jgi:hypothetical protein
MDDYQHYIYKHIEGNEIVYIGVGKGARAFYSAQMGHRSPEHSFWLEENYNRGVIPVEFIETGLSKEEAYKREKLLISKYKPRFNKHHNPKHNFTKRDPEVVLFAKQLRECGYSYTQISYLLGGESLVARENKKTMSIWRMINE